MNAIKPLSVILAASSAASALAATNDVLFIGNSFTHAHVDPAYSFNRANVTDENGTGMSGVAGIFKGMTTQAGLSYKRQHRGHRRLLARRTLRGQDRDHRPGEVGHHRAAGQQHRTAARQSRRLAVVVLRRGVEL